MLEIHGKRRCPFAWRVRLTAREKGIPYEWVPFDVDSPDARAAHRNPERHSPMLWDAGFTLTESLVIAEYIEESCRGPALLPSDAKDRARARLLLATVVPKLEEREGQAALDAALGEDQPWLGGAAPTLPDLMIWPFLSLQEQEGAPIPPGLARARRYWHRAKEHPALTATRP